MSDFLKLNLWDIAKALIVAFLSAFVTAIYTTIQAGTLPTWPEVQSALMVGLAAMLAYLVKNLFTPAPPAEPTE
jgi:VIT1/CCC1 family predicted Fe2+/Mn2+ transporter